MGFLNDIFPMRKKEAGSQPVSDVPVVTNAPMERAVYSALDPEVLEGILHPKVATGNFLTLFMTVPEVFWPIDFIASRIAAHAADIAKGVPHATDRDNAMAEARHAVDWEKMFEIAVDGEKARAYFESTPPADRHTCSMCGKMCAVRTTNMILSGEKVEFCSEK